MTNTTSNSFSLGTLIRLDVYHRKRVHLNRVRFSYHRQSLLHELHFKVNSNYLDSFCYGPF